MGMLKAKKDPRRQEHVVFQIRVVVYILSSFRVRIYHNCVATCHPRSLQMPRRFTSIVTFAMAISFRASELDKFVKFGFVCTLQQLGYT